MGGGVAAMIVYNVDRAWFTLKADAGRHRVSLKLPPKATATVRVDSREELAALLNALCSLPDWRGRKYLMPTTMEHVAEPEVILRACVPEVIPPDFVPRFLIERDGA